ncbi:MAG: DEAD/DEAH box helicase [Deltaproteobacteria bacterium]|nr:DEAD/DEAH box helicase [Deltaproteobacteria bacterium]
MSTTIQVGSFEDFNLDAKITKAIKSIGFNTPTPIQAKAIPEVQAGHDLLASAQTGTGKTAAYMLPILSRLMQRQEKRRVIRALVLAPTRELAMQVSRETERFGKYLEGFSVGTIVGGVAYAKQIQKIRRGLDVLVATPGRLSDLMDSGRVDLSQVQVLILDEADRMLDMGFTEDVHYIAEATSRQRQTLLFSATLGKNVSQLARRLLREPKRVEIDPDLKEIGAIEQSIHYAEGQGHKASIVKHILGLPDVERTIIFTATKHQADRVATTLSRSGYSAGALHGDMRQNARNRTIGSLRSGQINVLVATDVAARGLDIDKVSHIINYDIPHSAEDYVHRIGRTGRAGKSGTAVSLVTIADKPQLKDIETFIGHKIKPSLIPGLEPSNLALFEILQGGDSDSRKFGSRSGRGGRSRGRRMSSAPSW